MSGGQGKSFINLGSKLREGIAQQDYGDKYIEFVVQNTVYRYMRYKTNHFRCGMIIELIHLGKISIGKI